MVANQLTYATHGLLRYTGMRMLIERHVNTYSKSYDNPLSFPQAVERLTRIDARGILLCHLRPTAPCGLDRRLDRRC